MKAVLLARVSTKKQEDEGLSLDNQEEALKNYAKEHGMEVVKDFVFQESAGHKIRKKFDEMVAYMKDHEDVKVVLAYRVDRTTRNFRDAVMLDHLRIEHDKELHFVYNRLVLKADSRGRDIQDWDLQVFLAKQYLNRLQEDGANTWLYKLRNGEWATKATCGYRNVTLEGNKSWVELDPDRAPLVKKAFELYATGNWSFKALAKKLADMGLTTNTKSQRPMYASYLEDQIIKNPFYYGEMRYKGKLYPHNYDRIIPKWLFYKCEQVAQSYNKKPFKYGAKAFTFKGLLECGKCGKSLSTYIQKEHNYVRCHSCKAVHCREEKLIKQVSKMFKALKIPDEVVQDLTEKLNELHKDEQNFYENNVHRIEADIKKNKKRMEVLYEDRLDGRITHDEYDTMVVDLKRKEADLLGQLQGHSKADEAFLISSSYVLELANRAEELFEKSQVKQQNELLRFVLANASVEGEKLVYKLKNPFAGIVLCNETGNWLGRRDSNPRMHGPEPCALPLGDSPWYYQKQDYALHLTKQGKSCNAGRRNSPLSYAT